MVTRRILLLLSLCAVAAFVGCSGKVAGDVTETGNAEVAVVLVNQHGNAVDNARLIVLLHDTVPLSAPVAVDTFDCGTDSIISIVLDSGATYSFLSYVEGASLGAISLPVALDRDSTLRLVIRPLVTYSGVAFAGAGTGTLARRVILGGTGYSDTIDLVDSTFTIENIPQGTYTVVVESEVDGSTVRSIVGSRLIDSATTLRADSIGVVPPVLLLDDFNDNDNFGSLRPLLGGSWWDVVRDNVTEGTSTVSSPVDASYRNFWDALDKTDSARGSFVTVQYAVGDSTPLYPPYFPYAGLELNIGDHIARNFASLDSVSFMAKGDGVLRFELIQNGYESQVRVAATVLCPLSSAWHRFVIARDSLSIRVDWFPLAGKEIANFSSVLSGYSLPDYTAGTPPTTWEETGGRFNQVEFLASSGTTFSVDDIRVYGVSVDSIR